MEENKKKKWLEPSQAVPKAQAWCTYQERSQQEARDKLYEWGLHRNEVENIIADLITSGFINEERFAKAYAGGKFRIKKWGRVKIRLELKRKQITDYCIRKGLQEIDDREYSKTLKKVLEEKARSITEKNPLKRNYKVAQYAISRGFEPELVWDMLRGEEE